MVLDNKSSTLLGNELLATRTMLSDSQSLFYLTVAHHPSSHVPLLRRSDGGCHIAVHFITTKGLFRCINSTVEIINPESQTVMRRKGTE